MDYREFNDRARALQSKLVAKMTDHELRESYRGAAKARGWDSRMADALPRPDLERVYVDMCVPLYGLEMVDPAELLHHDHLEESAAISVADWRVEWTATNERFRRAALALSVELQRCAVCNRGLDYKRARQRGTCTSCEQRRAVATAHTVLLETEGTA